LTDAVELLVFAVTVNVPEPPGPVSQVSLIVSGPAATGVGAVVALGLGDAVAVLVTRVVANAVVEIASATPPASDAATADFKIDMMNPPFLNPDALWSLHHNAARRVLVTEPARERLASG
jgi:hypothetical protein